MVREVPLSQGKFALVDDDDFDRVMRHKWTAATSNGRRWYAKRSILQDGKCINCLLHRFILGVPDAIRIDHENGDGLDCRKVNMRYASPRQNARNMRRSARNTSGFKGVHRVRDGWIAQISADGKPRFLGVHESKEYAARVYDAAARRLFGEFARCNFADRNEDAERDVAHRFDLLERGERVYRTSRRCYSQRLTDQDVSTIRTRYLAGDSVPSLADEYGVKRATVYHCLSGRTFKHVTDPPPLTFDKRTHRVPSEQLEAELIRFLQDKLAAAS